VQPCRAKELSPLIRTLNLAPSQIGGRRSGWSSSGSRRWWWSRGRWRAAAGSRRRAEQWFTAGGGGGEAVLRLEFAGCREGGAVDNLFWGIEDVRWAAKRRGGGWRAGVEGRSCRY
jgi:hypothetical protein